MEKKWIAISVILAIICACVVMSVPVIKVAYTVKEPYTTTETYYVKEPYTESVPLSYTILDWDHYNHFWTTECDVWVKLQNTDDVGGYFRVSFDVETTKGSYKSTTSRIFLGSGDDHTFKHTFGGRYVSSNYDVHRSDKSVTKYHEVPKQRAVTKYRDVTKYKYISAFEYLMQEET